MTKRKLLLLLGLILLVLLSCVLLLVVLIQISSHYTIKDYESNISYPVSSPSQGHEEPISYIVTSNIGQNFVLKATNFELNKIFNFSAQVPNGSSLEVASDHESVIIKNSVFKFRMKLEYEGFPSAFFNNPEVINLNSTLDENISRIEIKTSEPPSDLEYPHAYIYSNETFPSNYCEQYFTKINNEPFICGSDNVVINKSQEEFAILNISCNVKDISQVSLCDGIIEGMTLSITNGD